MTCFYLTIALTVQILAVHTQNFASAVHPPDLNYSAVTQPVAVDYYSTPFLDDCYPAG